MPPLPEDWIASIKAWEYKQSNPTLFKQPAKVSVQSGSMSNSKNECEELGYTPKTEKYADCVMSLYQNSGPWIENNSAKFKSLEGTKCSEMGFKANTNQFGQCLLQLKQIAVQNQQYQAQLQLYRAQQAQIQEQQKQQQAQAWFDIANKALGQASGTDTRRNHTPNLKQPVLMAPIKIRTPSGNSYTCSYQGATLACQ